MICMLLQILQVVYCLNFSYQCNNNLKKKITKKIGSCLQHQLQQISPRVGILSPMSLFAPNGQEIKVNGCVGVLPRGQHGRPEETAHGHKNWAQPARYKAEVDGLQEWPDEGATLQEGGFCVNNRTKWFKGAEQNSRCGSNSNFV